MIRKITTNNERKLNVWFLVIGLALYVLGICLALMLADSTLSKERALLFIGFVGPTALLMITYNLGLIINRWFGFWYSWLPSLLSDGFSFTKRQILGIYGISLIVTGAIIMVIIPPFVDSRLRLIILLAYTCGVLVTLWRVSCMFTRTPFLQRPHVPELADGQQLARAQLLSHPNMSERQVKNKLAYKQLLASYPNLPEYEILESQLYECMQSYALLQQGKDNEDLRFTRELRACIMSQYISLAASNLGHTFDLQNLYLTHLYPLSSTTKNDEQASTSFAAIIHSDLNETIYNIHEAKRQKLSVIPTPFYIEFTVTDLRLLIYRIDRQESSLEQSTLKDTLLLFASQSNLQYVPRMASSLAPKAGLLASSGVLSKKVKASNCLTGHTDQHAFYLLSMQPYVPILNDKSYVVGCTVISKTHDRIIVADKHSRLFRYAELLPIQRITTESSDFSTRFGIFIEQESTIPSLEILNHTFMQTLLNTNHEISIEIIARQLYIYWPTTRVSIEDFSAVFEIMKSIHNELRL